jgi:hypothetical protein
MIGTCGVSLGETPTTEPGTSSDKRCSYSRGRAGQVHSRPRIGHLISLGEDAHGLGDVFPLDYFHIVTGIVALNGLLLIDRSGSSIYISVEGLRPRQSCAEPARATAFKKR